MKKYFFPLLALMALTSCKKETTPDPDGANSISINYTVPSPNWAPLILYNGPDQDPASTWPYIDLRFGIYDNSMNFVFFAVRGTDMTYANFFSAVSYGGEMINVGKVNGLGDVVTKPTSGWTGSSAVEAGHGYVLRCKNSWSYSDAALPYSYYRVYVTSLILNTYGGVIGAKVKYQGPF